MTCNTSISSEARFCSVFAATAGCSSPPDTRIGGGTPLLLHTGFEQTKPHTSADVFSLLGKVYVQTHKFPLQYCFGGNISPGCNSLCRVQHVSCTSPCPSIPSTAQRWDQQRCQRAREPHCHCCPWKRAGQAFHQLPAHNPSFVCACQAMGSCCSREMSPLTWQGLICVSGQTMISQEGTGLLTAFPVSPRYPAGKGAMPASQGIPQRALQSHKEQESKHEAIRMLLTHRREPLGTGVVGEVGKVFRKKRCGLQKGLIVVQIKWIIWRMGKKRKRLHLRWSFLFPATSSCHS